MKLTEGIHAAFFSLVLTLAVWPASQARAEADYRGLDKAVTNLFVVLDKLVVEVPKVSTAKDAAQALDSWSAANDAVSTAGQTVVRLNPQFESNPPPRFTQYFKTCTSLSTNYASVSVGIGSLIAKYRQDSAFSPALARYQRSLQRLETLLKLGVIDKE